MRRRSEYIRHGFVLELSRLRLGVIDVVGHLGVLVERARFREVVLVDRMVFAVIAVVGVGIAVVTDDAPAAIGLREFVLARRREMLRTRSQGLSARLGWRSAHP